VARLLASLGGFALLVGLLLVPALFFDDGGAHAEAEQGVVEPTTITSYVADFTVGEDGGMDVVETLTVDFPVSNLHGIFRFFDRLDPSAPDVRHHLSDVEVTVDGDDVPVDRSQEDLRYDVLRIGDPGAFVSSGTHVYEIRYHVTGALTPGRDVDEPSQLYWNLVPQGWQQEIAETDLTVHLPAPAADVRCAVGVGEDDTGECRVRGEGTTDLRIRTGALDDHTPVTVLVGQDLPTPDLTTLPWAPRYDRVLGSRLWIAGSWLGLGLAAAALAVWWLLRTRDPEPPFPLQYAPPEGIGPAQAHYVLTEQTGPRQLVASLMYAAEHGALELVNRKDGHWQITYLQGADPLFGTDRVTKSLASLLGGKPGSALVVKANDPGSGRQLAKAFRAHRAALEGWVNKERVVERSGPGAKGRLAVVGSLVLLLVWVGLVLGGVVHVSFFALPLAAIAGLGLPLLRSSATTRRTPHTRELWSRIGGFRRMLSTPSAEARFDFAGRESLYTSYLPWAVAFGCADRWAEKFQVETGQPPPAPSYLRADGAAASDLRSAATVTTAVSSMVDDFDTTVDRAIGAYTAAAAASSSSSSSSGSSSSSSSSSGFSGGGAGAGGGGGPGGAG
jgi:uncharacterized membrane protein YgcG